MARMSYYKTVNYKCSYLPCGHKGSKLLHKYDIGKTEFCPKCNLFTYKSNRLNMFSNNVLKHIEELTNE